AAPALQVIVLGSGGGPHEANVTAFLVRSLAAGWKKGSVVAVDAGVHLSAIARILEATQPAELGQTEALSLPYTLTTGPFAGLELPHVKATANAAHVHRSLIDTYLITHPHLDHISGFVINTAGLPGSRPKRLAGLPSTISAFKTHIFNNVIWPNLSDENNGAGLVTYMRLVEGGSPALGDGDGKGYLEISDGLAVKIWSVSHGHCIEKHSHRGSGSSTRYGSMDTSSMGMVGMSGPMMSPRTMVYHNSANASLGSFLQQQQQREQAAQSVCVYDSSAYFLRDMATGREILIFGDVEPDSISLSPRNLQIWQEAAPKIVAGNLAAIFIECSYDDSQSVDRLFGHLTPRFIVEEMNALAGEVAATRLVQLQEKELADRINASDKKKRKREGDDGLLGKRKPSSQVRPTVATPTENGVSNNPPTDDPVSPKTLRPPVRVSSGSGSLPEDGPMLDTPHLATPTAELSLREAELSTPVTPLSAPAETIPLPLKGLRVVIIHVKERQTDGEPAGDVILAELEEHEKDAQLGVEYSVSSEGQSIYL
ncbi:hypothetical protein GQ53DRAFT_622090, partial [Thozetella sp. PMI_491]